MVKAVIGAVMVSVCLGCAGGRTWNSMRINDTRSEAKTNNERFMDLKLGLSREVVLRMMGPPAKRDVFSLGEGESIEFLFYRTRGWGPTQMQDDDSQFTPVAIKNGFVAGWGRTLYEKIVGRSMEMTIISK